MFGAFEAQVVANVADSIVGNTQAFGYFFQAAFHNVFAGRGTISLLKTAFEGGKTTVGKLRKVFDRSGTEYVGVH